MPDEGDGDDRRGLSMSTYAPTPEVAAERLRSVDAPLQQAAGG
jgi:hypothetical protein